jgi:hypothetical protein
MASTLKINTLTGVTTAGSIAVTAEGNSTTTNLQQGLLKCWYNLKGDSTASIRDSLNTGSLTDNGTGDYSITFTNNMANNDYYYGTTQRANSRTAGVATESDLETSKIDNTLTFDSLGSNVDRDIQGGCVAGDLA